MTYPRLRHNLFAFGIDAIMFGLAIKLIDPVIVLPAFATQLGASNTLVGLLVTVFFVSENIPQLFAGNYVARFQHKKPLLVIAAAIGRPAIFLFGLFLLLSNGASLWLTMLLLFLALAVMFVSDAFAALAWFDLLGRAFPPEKRGGYLASWGLIRTFGVIGISGLIGYLLSENGPPFPQNYGYMFVAGSFALLVSFISLSRIYEPPLADEEIATFNIPWSDFGGHLSSLWRADQRLRQVNIARVILSLGLMASTFYVVYATQERSLSVSTIGFFLPAQTIGTMVGSLMLGRIADRFGSSRVIQVASVFVVLAPLLALSLTFLPDLPAIALQAAFIVIYFLIGVSENVMVLGFMNYVLDIAKSGQRTIYLGVSNAISTLGVLGALLAGWILSVSSYPVLFTIAALFALSALILAFRMPTSRNIPAPESTT